MRRQFIPASETPRPFSDILAERRSLDPAGRLRENALARIATFEREAAEAADPAERKRLQCEAESYRCRLDEEPRR